MKKITRTTLKSFIRKNRENLLINVASTFDGQVDGCRSTGDRGFSPALDADGHNDNTLGIAGAWFVGGGRDYFTPIDDATHAGYVVSNCCGRFSLAVAK